MKDPRSAQADSLVLRPPAFPRDAFAYCVPLTAVVADIKKPDVAIVDTLLEPLELPGQLSGQLHGVPLSMIRSWHVLPLFEDEGYKYPTGWLSYSVSKIPAKGDKAWFRYHCAVESSCGDHHLSRLSRVTGYSRSAFRMHLASAHNITVDMDQRRAHRTYRGRCTFCYAFMDRLPYITDRHSAHCSKLVEWLADYAKQHPVTTDTRSSSERDSSRLAWLVAV